MATKLKDCIYIYIKSNNNNVLNRKLSKYVFARASICLYLLYYLIVVQVRDMYLIVVQVRDIYGM